ncbi:Clavaminate synthase-like protein [Polyplosphaeria fusca]|uniref:Clavaminate synthase-like protein n=1 Tax=Polyplosphaeria fusca TaxID=682080 RepID=A0A9P4V0H6_9PLEO|nr:Clavaminate synthase-like protein [Polyplosphaeria fusca]
MKRRQLLLAQLDLANRSIPAQFPRQISSPSTLSSEQLDLTQLTFELDQSDIGEIEFALRTFDARHGQPNDISRVTFPLPTLGPRLRAISADLHRGSGLAILKNLQPDKYTPWENMVLYAGIASYIGDVRGTQSGSNHVLTHLRVANNVSDPRPSFMRDDLPFHNDNGEILSLYIVEPAASGGNTMISSAGHVYNELVRTKPYLIDVLAKDDWPHWTARKPTKEKCFPLLFPGENQTPYFGFTRYSLTGSESSPKPEHIRPLTLLQAEAMDSIEMLAAKNAVALPQRKGDLHFISNRAFFHARKAYQDLSMDNARHLMRLILMDSEFGHALTTAEKVRWGASFEFSPDQAAWILEKEHTHEMASSSEFDSLYLDETTHTSS